MRGTQNDGADVLAITQARAIGSQSSAYISHTPRTTKAMDILMSISGRVIKQPMRATV